MLVKSFGCGEPVLPDRRSCLGAGFETVILKDGQRITGEVVAEKQNALYVDLGYDLLRIPRDQITRRTKLDEAAHSFAAPAPGVEADPSGLFSTGLLKPSPVKELVSKFGEAVISIETPSGQGIGFHRQQGRLRDHQRSRDPG